MEGVLHSVVKQISARRPAELKTKPLAAIELGAESIKHADYVLSRLALGVHAQLSACPPDTAGQRRRGKKQSMVTTSKIGMWQLTDVPGSSLDGLRSSWAKRPHNMAAYLPPPMPLRFEDPITEWKTLIRNATAEWEQHEASLGAEMDVQLEMSAAVDIIFTANTLHVAHWSACSTMFENAGACLRDGGCLLVYGPFVVPPHHRAAMTNHVDSSNALAQGRAQELFGKGLRNRFGPQAGLRDIGDVLTVAAAAGLDLRQQVILPEGNIALAWHKLKGA